MIVMRSALLSTMDGNDDSEPGGNVCVCVCVFVCVCVCERERERERESLRHFVPCLKWGCILNACRCCVAVR